MATLRPSTATEAVAAGLEASGTLQENWTEVEVTLVTEMSGRDGALWALAVTGPRTVE